ncbi:signal peptidase I [Arthrobacter bambusae]|uniref:Signal peptidase I n=1 Tax=Arthrobacter bambusae TaxID=1338426 RepID=A0AAW8DF61_9MICC|nr:signal peptidase I [Arthrobacter bambusae]MDP9903704.1 signal peptidase I [Arthrobacter bambusae]MDQ0128301.1 signal peptidase I [Arthrobacter bambusae]MDQ0179643.1 signal peptidase I [Arthrobacter bambusae]
MTASLVRPRRVSRTATTTATPGSGKNPGLASKIARALVSVITTTIMVAAVAAFLFLAVGPRVLGYQTSTMLTGSMSPLINPGDVVVTVPVAVQNLKVGDIITYHIPVEDQRVETHRIIDLTVNNQGTATVRTKGDANNGADPWTATLAGGQVDRQVFTVPYLGNAIRALRDPVVLKVLMYGAPAALVVMVLVSIWRKKPEGDDGAVDTGAALPAFDRRPLKRLAREMKSKEAAEKFAAAYAKMLPQRVDKISHALSTGDSDLAMDAVLSLKTSSSMVGALRMEQHCVRLEHALVTTDHTAAAQAGELVRQHQPQLEKALGGHTTRRAA